MFTVYRYCPILNAIEYHKASITLQSYFFGTQLMSQPLNITKIDMLLPSKESFSARNAGAVSTIVRDLVVESSESYS